MTDANILLRWLRYERIDGVPDEERRRQAAALIQRQAAELEAMEARKDAAYEERNRVVALAARMAHALGMPAGLAKTAIEGWSEDWDGLVFMELPTGQVSWHFHDSHKSLFNGIKPLPFVWDGHSTEEKYRRCDAALRESQP